MKLLKGEILSNHKYGEDLYKMEIFSPYICRNANPGQFINVKCSPCDVLDPLLRRPFSIYEIENKFHVFSIMYIVKGKGTRYLSTFKKGDNLDFVGPLGRMLKIDNEYEKFLLAGGGMGVAGLYFLANKLLEAKKKVLFLAGFKDRSYIGWERDLIELKTSYKIFSEDGLWGERGFITDFIRKNIKKYKKYKFYCCGPKNMLVAVQEMIKKANIPAVALLEERMACGVGVCKGCAVKVKDIKDKFVYRTVCKDGPGFDLGEVIFD